jgi:hypothetical protein
MIWQSFEQDVPANPPEETMVKRIAQVLAEPDSENWPSHVKQAKRVLLTMQGPTRSMLAAVEENSSCWQPLSDDWDTMLQQAIRDADPVVFQNVILRTGS